MLSNSVTKGDSKVKLVGWISAQKSDKACLRGTFNVQGKMIYNKTMGCFEYCTLDSMEVVEKLRCGWPDFFAGAFTAIDDEGNQLPQQPCWGLEDGLRSWNMREGQTRKHFGRIGWIRGFYNNLGLRFDLNGNMEWSQFWPPQIWMFRNLLWNSGLARRSRIVYRIFLWLDDRR